MEVEDQAKFFFSHSLGDEKQLFICTKVDFSMLTGKTVRLRKQDLLVFK